MHHVWTAPNKGIIWTYLVRYSSEENYGFEVQRSGKSLTAISVVEYGPAWRGGIRVGSVIRYFNLDPGYKEKKQLFDESSMEILNEHPPELVIGIQIKNIFEDELLRKRKLFVRKQKVRADYSRGMRLLLI